jgi:hypothetical protein
MRMKLNLIANFCLGSVNFSFFQHRGNLNLVIWNFLSLKSLRIGEFKWNLWWTCTVLWSNACVCRIGFMLVGVLIVYWHFHGDPFWQVIPSLHWKCSQMICIVKACMRWWNSFAGFTPSNYLLQYLWKQRRKWVLWGLLGLYTLVDPLTLVRFLL